VFIVVVDFVMTQSGNFWVLPRVTVISCIWSYSYISPLKL